MGSRFMHLLVADHVGRELGIEERGQMLLGSLAPDAEPEKREAHFKGRLHAYAFNRPVDYSGFVIKYRDHMKEPFFLGYLTHLVMDDVWTMKTDFSGFEERVRQNRELYEMYHGDLYLCNAKLHQAYQPEGLYEQLRDESLVPKLDEVSERAVLEYKEVALTDFQYPSENVTKPLQLFTFEEMVHYVERSMSKALDVCHIVYRLA